MDDTVPTDPLAYQKWLDELERNWQAGLIPDPRAVAIIVMNHGGEVLLQLRDSEPNVAFANSWTLPGGVVETDESPGQAAQRELAEETGLRLDLSHWRVYRRKPRDRQFLIEQHIYIGISEKGASELTLGEGQSLRFFGRDEIPSLSIAFGFGKLLDEFFIQMEGG